MIPLYRRDHKPWKRIGPKHRRIDNNRNSICGSAKLSDLDWSTWWLDDGYIHVRRWREDEGDTFHRVYPRFKNNTTVSRVSVENGIPYWLYDPIIHG